MINIGDKKLKKQHSAADGDDDNYVRYKEDDRDRSLQATSIMKNSLLNNTNASINGSLMQSRISLSILSNLANWKKRIKMGEDGQLLMKIIEAFRSEIKKTDHYHITEGHTCHEVLTLSKFNHKTILMDKNKVILFDTVTRQYQSLYESENAEKLSETN